MDATNISARQELCTIVSVTPEKHRRSNSSAHVFAARPSRTAPIRTANQGRSGSEIHRATDLRTLPYLLSRLNSEATLLSFIVYSIEVLASAPLHVSSAVRSEKASIGSPSWRRLYEERWKTDIVLDDVFLPDSYLLQKLYEPFRGDFRRQPTVVRKNAISPVKGTYRTSSNADMSRNIFVAIFEPNLFFSRPPV